MGVLIDRDEQDRQDVLVGDDRRRPFILNSVEGWAELTWIDRIDRIFWGDERGAGGALTVLPAQVGIHKTAGRQHPVYGITVLDSLLRGKDGSGAVAPYPMSFRA